jgi:hypothetical protein
MATLKTMMQSFQDRGEKHIALEIFEAIESIEGRAQ